MTASRWKVGAAVAAGYVAVALATLGLSGHRILPLFEGVGPPTPYRWVHPPPRFAASNVAPVAVSTPIAFNGAESEPVVPQTPDVQFAVTLSQGALLARGDDRSAQIALTPLDPATLGAVPPGLAADGNAYRVTITYEPSGTPVTSLALDGDVFMITPHRAKVMLYSADGRTWSKLITQSLGSPTDIGTVFSRPGWYLAGALPSVVNGSGSGGSGTITIAVIVAVAAAALGTLATLIRRRRRGRGSGTITT